MAIESSTTTWYNVKNADGTTKRFKSEAAAKAYEASKEFRAYAEQLVDADGTGELKAAAEQFGADSRGYKLIRSKAVAETMRSAQRITANGHRIVPAEQVKVA